MHGSTRRVTCCCVCARAGVGCGAFCCGALALSCCQLHAVRVHFSQRLAQRQLRRLAARVGSGALVNKTLLLALEVCEAGCSLES
jgi:hypothetical protein